MSQSFQDEDDEFNLEVKHKGGDNSKCVVCGSELGTATFGKVCMKCHDAMIKRQ